MIAIPYIAWGLAILLALVAFGYIAVLVFGWWISREFAKLFPTPIALRPIEEDERS